MCVCVSTAEKVVVVRNNNLPGGARKEQHREGRCCRPALTCFRHEGDKKKKTDFSVRFTPLPPVGYTSWTTNLWSCEATLLLGSQQVFVWQLKNGLPYTYSAISGRIQTPYVAGMSAFYFDSLEMLGENAMGKCNENNSKVKSEMSTFSRITAWSMHLRSWGTWART